MAVSRESALLNLAPDIETSIPVDSDHTNLVKFNTKEDAAYREIKSRLGLFLEQYYKKGGMLIYLSFTITRVSVNLTIIQYPRRE